MVRMEKMRDIVISVVISVALLTILLLVLVIGSYIYTFIAPPYQIEDQYEVFKDLLTVILTIAGIAIGTVGYVIYRHVSERIESRMSKNAEVIESGMRKKSEASLDLGVALTLCLTSYTFWQSYENTKQYFYLEGAIALTETAYERMSYLDVREPKNESLMCEIMNNLGYYLAERKKGEDKEFAIVCANYIKDKMGKYPDQRGNWKNTYDFIFRQYP